MEESVLLAERTQREKDELQVCGWRAGVGVPYLTAAGWGLT